MIELQRTPRNDFHELSGKKKRSRVHGPDCHPDKSSYGSTQEASKEDRRDICTSSTGLFRQYQCCRDRKRRRFDQSIPSMPHKKPAASVSVQQLKDPVPPKAALSRHCTWGKQKTPDKQPEVEEPELARRNTVALQAAWSLLADIKQGDRRLIPALTKMIEAAVNATKLLM